MTATPARDATRAALQTLLSLDLPMEHHPDSPNCGECWECVAGTVGIAIAMRRPPGPRPYPDEESVYASLSNLSRKMDPDLVAAALVESGWRPSAAQLRAMGAERMTTQVLPGRLVKCWTFPEGVDGD